MMIGLQQRLASLQLKNIDGRLLDEADRLRFNNFIDGFVRSRNKTVIYRGNAKLESIYGCGTDNLYMLASYIFMLGEKGRYFWERNPRFQLDIGENDDVFEYIWKRMHNKVCNVRTFSCAGTRSRVVSFLDKSRSFGNFFRNEDNKGLFLSLLKRCTPEEQEFICDYYITILHTIGLSGIRGSYFVSSSTLYSVARSFAGKDGIVIIGWIPSRLRRTFSICDRNDNRLRILGRYGLPVCESYVYPEQCEISLKCGMLPHFMLGFTVGNSFVVNPSLFETLDNGRSVEEIIKNGLDVNQTDFDHYLANSSYRRAYVLDDNGFRPYHCRR